jgi:hypothetical protein
MPTESRLKPLIFFSPKWEQFQYTQHISITISVLYKNGLLTLIHTMKLKILAILAQEKRWKRSIKRD